MSDVFKEKLSKILFDSWKRTIPSSDEWDNPIGLRKKIQQIRKRKCGIDVLRRADRRNKRSLYRPGIELAMLEWVDMMGRVGCEFHSEFRSGDYLLENPCLPSNPDADLVLGLKDASNLDFRKIRYVFVPVELAIRIVSLGYIP